MINIKSSNTNYLTQDNSCRSFDSIKPCIYDKGITGDAVNNILIGDSHAESLAHVFSQVMDSRSESFAVWTKGNCPFILRESIQDVKYREVLTELDTVNSKVSCLEHNQQIMDYVSDKEPMRVWVTNRNTQGYRATFSWNISNDSLRNLVKQNLMKLAVTTTSVVYVGPVPEKVYTDVPSHRLIWQLRRGTVSNFGIRHLPSGPFDDNHFFSGEVWPTNLVFLNPIDVFCREDSCALGEDYKFYSDSHHLNASGSEKLKEKMDKALEYRVSQTA